MIANLPYSKCSKTDIVNDGYMREYIDEFLTSISSLEFTINVTNKFNYKVTATISQTKGVAIEFYPNNENVIDIIFIEDSIEHIFPKIDADVKPTESSTIIVFEKGINTPCLSPGNNNNITLIKLFLITNNRQFIELQDTSELCF